MFSLLSDLINYRQMAVFQYVLAYIFFALSSPKLQANGIFPVEFNFLDAMIGTETSIKSNKIFKVFYHSMSKG